jgi:hypothetical protein
MLWHWGFFMSVFALISSVPTRLLQHLPQKDDMFDFDDDKIRVALNLFLQPPMKPDGSGPATKYRRRSKKMLWVWQCPTMLVSYSWVLVLVGYALHLLTPAFRPEQAEVSLEVSREIPQFHLIFELIEA